MQADKAESLLPAPGNVAMTGTEAKAVLDYQSSSGFLNGKLRSDQPLGASATEGVKNLDSAFSKCPPLAEDITTYRGLPGGIKLKLVEGGVGTVIQDKGYVSTSKNKHTAESFGNGSYLYITSPKGTKVLDLNATLKQKSLHKGEHEVLLPRGTRFKVTKIELPPAEFGYSEESRKIRSTIHVIAIPPGSNP
jgi:hypothetical protein